MKKKNIASVSWGDHLLFGQGEGKLDTPKSFEKQLVQWKKHLNISTILWRETKTGSSFDFFSARGHKYTHFKKSVNWDDFEAIPRICRNAGVSAYLYVTLFDEGWPLPPKKVRQVSYHNAMHGRHWSRQSQFTRNHPEYLTANRTGEIKQWGVPCLAYPEVRRHYRGRYLKLLKGYHFDGLFLCLRSQSKPADYADQFGFNKPIKDEYRKRYGKNILKEDFDLQKWRDLQGEYLTRFLIELREPFQGTDIKLSIGIPRGEVIGPPLGNWTLQWREWLKMNLIDDLIIDQNSSQCPSMWHQLWPMHRGHGYVQNYIDGKNMPPLKDQLDEVYQPIISKYAQNLFIARQWQKRNPNQENELRSHPSVTGLVYSTFRFDNPQAIEKGDWKA